jgi:hypothetical protein
MSIISKKFLNNSNQVNNTTEDFYNNQFNSGKLDINYSFSKKGLSNNNISKNTNQPRINELISNKIFQHFFKLYYESSDYGEFKLINDSEKLCFMIDLFFYIIGDINKDFIGDYSLGNLSTEQYFSNMNNELIEKINSIKSDFGKKKIIDIMKKYGLYNDNNTNDLNYQFNEILYTNNYDNTNIKNEKRINFINQSQKDFKCIIPKSNDKRKKRTMSSDNTKNNAYKNQNNLFSKTMNNNYPKSNSFIKIDFEQLNLEKIGPIKKGNFYNLKEENMKEILFTTNKYVFFSNNNNISNNEIVQYICNNNLSKLKTPFISPLNYKCLSNPKKTNIIHRKKIISTKNNFYSNSTPIVIEDGVMLSKSNIDTYIRNNIILIKNKNGMNEMNSLLNKLFYLDENVIMLNKNEVNKIGILLIKYVQLEKEIQNINNKIFKEKEQFEKLKETISNYSISLSDRLNESQKFIQSYK